MSGAIWRRRLSLVRWLVEVVDSSGPDGVALPELVEAGALLRNQHGRSASAKTVDNTIGDLCAFGAFRKARIGRVDVFVRITVLGQAWMRGVLLPYLDEREALREIGDEIVGPEVKAGDVPAAEVEWCVTCEHRADEHLSSGGCGACSCRRLAIIPGFVPAVES